MKIKIKVTGIRVSKRNKVKNDYKNMLEDATKRVWLQGVEDYKGMEYITFKQL